MLQGLYSSLNRTDLSRQKVLTTRHPTHTHSICSEISFSSNNLQAIIRGTQCFAQYSARPIYSFFTPSAISLDEESSYSLTKEQHSQFIFEEPLRVPLHYAPDQLDEVSSIYVCLHMHKKSRAITPPKRRHPLC